MSKYECSNVIGIRAKQLNDGAPTLVEVSKLLNENFVYIAAKELHSRKLVVSIRRPMPLDGYYDIVSSELRMPDDLGVFVDMWEQQQ